MKEGDKYLSGNIDLGIAEIEVLVFKNEKKKDEKHPDWNICVKRGEKTKRIGVLWTQTKKAGGKDEDNNFV